MAVSLDKNDDLQIDFSAKNHAFSLDNVSYITHKDSDHQSQAKSEATTAIIGTLRRNNNNTNNIGTLRRNNNNTNNKFF
jgi:protocadherin-15